MNLSNGFGTRRRDAVACRRLSGRRRADVPGRAKVGSPMEARVTNQLTSKQAAFVEEFLKDHSPAGAALRAGYSAKSGKRLLADPAVAAEVAKREAEFEHDVTVSTRTLLADADRA